MIYYIWHSFLGEKVSRKQKMLLSEEQPLESLHTALWSLFIFSFLFDLDRAGQVARRFTDCLLMFGNHHRFPVAAAAGEEADKCALRRGTILHKCALCRGTIRHTNDDIWKAFRWRRRQRD
jgi:hypothetical protein